ncbi:MULTISPECIES: MlaD family protein [unclassified Brenneria]|uniref:PqiB family protein n=1 Tax=unclassified Brenneria TaxID=2634434 RepID=UPI0029C23D96|nr:MULTISPECIES: MlaD family protein [unclassified Brenneria]MDX5629092.1 MlaD family protein [Brenneria sp. L3-3Z]MDX5696231.1 MlaD family protein [Brenneria sp. L4-2C]
MTHEHQQYSEPAVARRRWRLSPIWLVPGIALLIGVAMLINSWLSAGPELTLSFQTAAGLEAGKTAVKYKDVTVGIVKDITLNADSSRVMARVQLDKNAADLARADTRFWVVRPRVGIGGVTGIDTLLSGAYIGADKGNSPQSSRDFVGLESPPAIINGAAGSRFIVQTDDLGSLDIGSPVYYRRVQVGRIASYQLDDEGEHVNLQVFVEAPYDRFVTADSRFWNVSGLDLSVGANGFRLRTQTVAAIMAGGIAFATPEADKADKQVVATPTPPAKAYVLAKDQESAMAPSDGPAISFTLRFERSLHGLSVGAPVEFSSIKIGRVTAVDLDYSATGYRFPSVVGIEVYPSRLGNVLNKLPKPKGELERETAVFLRDLVAHGLRAQVSPSNFLTGQLYISLDFVPNAAKVPFDIHAQPLVLPTVNGGFDRLQEQMASIISKVDKMPLESIGQNLDATLAGLDKTLTQFNGKTLPETNQLIRQMRLTTRSAQDLLAEDSPLAIGFSQTLQDASRTLRALRNLADQLDRHPESLLRGRPTDPSLRKAEQINSSFKGAEK